MLPTLPLETPPYSLQTLPSRRYWRTRSGKRRHVAGRVEHGGARALEILHDRRQDLETVSCMSVKLALDSPCTAALAQHHAVEVQWVVWTNMRPPSISISGPLRPPTSVASGACVHVVSVRSKIFAPPMSVTATPPFIARPGKVNSPIVTTWTELAAVSPARARAPIQEGGTLESLATFFERILDDALAGNQCPVTIDSNPETAKLLPRRIRGRWESGDFLDDDGRACAAHTNTSAQSA
jgi:hypothetical protein